MSIDPFRQCDEMHRGAATNFFFKKLQTNQQLNTVFGRRVLLQFSDDIQYMLGCLLQLCAMIHIDIYSASFNLQ